MVHKQAIFLLSGFSDCPELASFVLEHLQIQSNYPKTR